MKEPLQAVNFKRLKRGEWGASFTPIQKKQGMSRFLEISSFASLVGKPKRLVVED